MQLQACVMRIRMARMRSDAERQIKVSKLSK